MAHGNGEDGGNIAVDPSDHEDMRAALQRFTAALRNVSDCLDNVDRNVPDRIKTNAKFQDSLLFMTIVKNAMEFFKNLLESSLGQKAFDLVWRQRSRISTVIHVGIQVTVAAVASICMQELTDVKEHELGAEIESIAKYIKAVEDMLPAMKRSVESAVEELRKLQENCSDKNLLEAGMESFEANIGCAKTDIERCKEYLRIALAKNQQCMDKITRIRRGYLATRVLGLGAAAAILFKSVKSAKLSTEMAFVIGAFAGGFICYYKTSRLEHLEQLYEKLKNQKEAHANLELEVRLTEDRLDDAITSYNTKIQNL